MVDAHVRRRILAANRSAPRLDGIAPRAVSASHLRLSPPAFRKKVAAFKAQINSTADEAGRPSNGNEKLPFANSRNEHEEPRCPDLQNKRTTQYVCALARFHAQTGVLASVPVGKRAQVMRKICEAQFMRVTARGKPFLCMDPLPRIPAQNRSHRCNFPRANKD